MLMQRENQLADHSGNWLLNNYYDIRENLLTVNHMYLCLIFLTIHPVARG